MYILETKLPTRKFPKFLVPVQSARVDEKCGPFPRLRQEPVLQSVDRIEDRDSPTYRKVDQEIDVRAQSLIFYLRPETIYGIIDILKNFFPPATEKEKTESRYLTQSLGMDKKEEKQNNNNDDDDDNDDNDDSQMLKHREERQQQETRQTQDQSFKPEAKSVERKSITNFKIYATLASVEVVLCAQQFFLAHLSVSGLSANVSFFPYSFDSFINLGTITLRDVTSTATQIPDYPYTEILSHVV
ncbi:hypothetical protein RFI_38468 [Reticulomyxa filosa]|uniref:Uncharacterized protein n=1 Tax=Reticulomyxa filosa TaxID=46433 RepID=X6LE53_RETFI|nr:hypothetical protein RFI_38468 [Reticulomyxa filosa]|eukprot:ETN99019.1 hypothetical protein RFI_38468 [Reticulomyxa filosa]